MSGLEGNKDKKYYGEPSPEVDAAWEALYSCTFLEPRNHVPRLVP